ncbi:MAG: Fic family protein, partial [Candidatus Saccharimonadales bacterium]
NYKKALDFIEKRKKSRESIELQDILLIHGLIMDSLLPTEKIGILRTVGVYIVDQDDNEIYVGPSSDIVESELKKLLAWLSNTNVHPVVAAALLHLQFVSIHPFSDGNGRTARVLTQLYLGLRDYDFRGPIVLDSYYLVDKQAYYNALHKVQGNNYKSARQAIVDSWIKYFADGFLSSARVLSVEVTIVSNVAGAGVVKKISRDNADLLNYAKQFGEITLADAKGIISNVSERTLQRKLKSLVDKGYLLPSGNARNTTYHWNGK